MAAVRFFLDENVQLAIAEQLSRRGIDVVSVAGLGLQGTPDIELLKRAAELERVFCTHDTDFVALAASVPHAGVIIGQNDVHTIGDWVRGLTLVHAILTAEDLQERLEWL